MNARALVALLAILMFVAEGFNVRSPRINPLGLGLALAAVVVFWPIFDGLH